MLDTVLSVVNRVLSPLGAKLESTRPKPAVTNAVATRFLLLADMFREIKGVEGCVVECGVAYGRGLSYLSFLTQNEGSDRIIYGFDTFAGYPSVSDRDQPKDAKFIPPQVGGLRVPMSETLRFIRASGISQEFIDKQVRLVEGDVTKTSKQYDGPPIALLITEMDLYSGNKAALENFLPHMAKGGIILPLNYGHAANKFPGGHEAVGEVFGDKAKDFRLHSWTGKRYYVHS
ncbi:MAG: TylF/MycF family methyltransferase [Ferrovibrio sp.]|uniref:TylF/MycF/NovP-related O-methyltransferase n=1 Tax=Ferrovibrio sp. TaxID=1917215 RepID=UPI00262A67BF|nr:TylF/MycF/NovP-related O-methyltransferase [Ferrovibrio sp.]MCW0234964.1 TylF/MycF family methyltransferase [Ferrovibrio sp.]